MPGYIEVEGKDRGKLLLFALSTCVWCKKTRRLLDELGVKYSYLYADLLTPAERDEVENDMLRWVERVSFPILIVDEQLVIAGYEEEQIREAVGAPVEWAL